MPRIDVYLDPALATAELLGTPLEHHARQRWDLPPLDGAADWWIDARALRLPGELVRAAARAGRRLFCTDGPDTRLMGGPSCDVHMLGQVHAARDAESVALLTSVAAIVQYEAELAESLRQQWLAHGVFVSAAGAPVVVGPEVQLEAGARLAPGCQLTGATTVGAGAVIGPGCQLHDATIGCGAQIAPYTVIDGAVVGAKTRAGPFAHLRPGTVLGEGCRVGNFVETKKTTMGDGAKASHLAYLGDAVIGARANIGAGSITCNYDGYRKHRTEVGEGAFVGTNCSLVAPVRIGNGALVAAGSTVTTPVEDHALAFGRARQRSIPGRGRTLMERNRRAKEAEREAAAAASEGMSHE